MSTDEQFLQPRALELFQAEAQAFPTVLAEFVAAVTALTDLDDDEQLQRRDEAAAELQLALARLNSAEYDYSEEMSFWPADDDEGYDYESDDDDEDDDDDDDEDGDDSAEAEELLSVIARLDLRVTNSDALKQRAMMALTADDELTDDEADQFSDSPLQAAQALLPEVAETLEDTFAGIAEVSWIYAGVSAGEFEREEDGFEDILEDEDHRAFYVEIFETEEEAKAAAEAAGDAVYHPGNQPLTRAEDDGPIYGDGDESDVDLTADAGGDGGSDGGGGGE